MCTVTIVPIPPPVGEPGGRFRMACSRDESHSRPPAQPPIEQEAPNGRRFLMPVDPLSGGTWVAVNEAGLALTLLNYNPPNPPTDRTLSRGGVVTVLAAWASVDDALDCAECLPADQMMPFRLVVCDGFRYAEWRSDHPLRSVTTQPLDRPVMFTSSGLGDHLVETPRRELFDHWFGDDPADHEAQQLAFHQHRWPDRPHLSVAMSRGDARTVSYTTVGVTPGRVTMAYHPDRPDLPTRDVTVALDRRPPKPVRW